MKVVVGLAIITALVRGYFRSGVVIRWHQVMLQWWHSVFCFINHTNIDGKNSVSNYN